MNICVDCEHHFFSNEQAHLKGFRAPYPEDHLCRASVLKEHPAWTNPVTGQMYSAFKIYDECEHVNFKGECPLFQQKPPEPQVKERSWSPLLGPAVLLLLFFIGFLLLR